MSNLHNALDQAVGVSLGLRKMFGGSAELAVERLGETLMPVVNPWEHAYCAWLRGETLFAYVGVAAAVAGEYSHVAVVNPSTSSSLVTIDSAKLSASAITDGRLVIASEAVIAATLTTTESCIASDTRAPGVPWPIGRVGSDPAATMGSFYEYFLLTTTPAEARNLPVILSPGFGLVALAPTVNTQVIGQFHGFTKRLLPGEFR